MRGLILLDGPDCAGKTTLANTLVSEVEKQGGAAVVHHLGLPEPNTCWDLHGGALLDYIEEMLKEDKVVIADRHFLSEGVYAAVYREGSEYPFTMRYMDMLFNRFRALKVICLPPIDVVVSKHAEMKKIRREEYDNGMDKVARRFERIWHDEINSKLAPGREYTEQLMLCGGVTDKSLWYRYDYTANDVHDYAKMLIEELDKEQWFYGDDTWDMRFTGTPGPLSTLLVGDKMSQVNKLGIPFFANTDSSLFLAKSLHKLMIPAERLCIVNINDENGVPTVRYLAERCKHVIALGREAERSLQVHDIDYQAYVRHPQHARRFNHNDESYTTELAYAFRG